MTNFFGPGSPYLTHPLLTEERTAAEVDRILSWCAETPSDVLDMGCGFGRHSIELAQRGYSVVGVEPSATLLSEARRRADAGGLSVEFVQAPGEAFVRPDAFDLAICLFTTLGQVDPESDAPGRDGRASAAATLGNLRRSLRPGGTLVLEVPDRARHVDALIEVEQLGPTSVTRSFDTGQSLLSEHFDTGEDNYDLAYVLFDRAELIADLEANDFAIQDVHDEAVQTPPFTFTTVIAQGI